MSTPEAAAAQIVERLASLPSVIQVHVMNQFAQMFCNAHGMPALMNALGWDEDDPDEPLEPDAI